MFCCSELSHYQTTLSIVHCARKPFNRRRLSGLPQCALSVWITAKVMPSIYNTHTHTLSQLRTQFTDGCVRECACRVLSVQCLFRLFTCYFDFWWFCFAFCLFRMLLFLEQGQLLETHTQIHLPTTLVPMLCRLVFRCFF